MIFNSFDSSWDCEDIHTHANTNTHYYNYLGSIGKIFTIFRYLENLIDYIDTIADILGQDAAYNQVGNTVGLRYLWYLSVFICQRTFVEAVKYLYLILTMSLKHLL